MSAAAGEDALLPEWTVDLVAGWASGAAAVAACQPVDTVLTRWQAASPLTTSAPGGAAGAGSVRGMAAQLCQTSGFAALWRGASPMIVSVPVQNALLMSGYGFGRRWFGCDGSQDNSSYSKRLGAIFVGGCTGGEWRMVLVFVVCI